VDGSDCREVVQASALAVTFIALMQLDLALMPVPSRFKTQFRAWEGWRDREIYNLFNAIRGRYVLD
jgi:hypothetical protein